LRKRADGDDEGDNDDDEQDDDEVSDPDEVAKVENEGGSGGQNGIMSTNMTSNDGRRPALHPPIAVPGMEHEGRFKENTTSDQAPIVKPSVTESGTTTASSSTPMSSSHGPASAAATQMT
jgi:hypothetical protein